MRLEGQAIFELKTNFSHRLVSNKNKELSEYLKTYSRLFNVLSTKPTKKLAYELSLQNGTNVPPPGVRKQLARWFHEKE